MKYKIDQIIADMLASSDLEKLLQSHELSTLEIDSMLTSKRGRAVLTARRRLARIHSRLVATRYAPFAVQSLCQLLTQEKPELRLKSAVSVLTVAGLAKLQPAKSDPAKNENDDPLTTLSDDQARDILQVLARKTPLPPDPILQSDDDPGKK